RADAIAVSFPESLGVPAGSRSKVTHTGMPVRDGILKVRGTPYPGFGEGAPLHVLVLGGSQGARILSDIVPDAVGRMDAAIRGRLKITQQCRPEDLARVTARYRALGIAAELAAFFDDVPE